MAFAHRIAVPWAARLVAGALDSRQVSALGYSPQVLTLDSLMLPQRGVSASRAHISRDKPPAMWPVKVEGKPETLCTTGGGEILPGVIGGALARRRRPVQGRGVAGQVPPAAPFGGQSVLPQTPSGEGVALQAHLSESEVRCCAWLRATWGLFPGEVLPHARSPCPPSSIKPHRSSDSPTLR